MRAPYRSRDAAVRQLAEAGVTVPDMARRLGCHQHSIRRVGTRLGIALPRIYNKADRARVVELYQSGMRWDDIADEADVDRSQISRFIRAAGVPLRSQAHP